ncbi:MAG: 3-hydroxyacyl-CoA dehydrogenase NAD-binding domain-containing protein [Parvularculaceae bacterium]
MNLPFEKGIEEERRLFMELIAGRQSAAQRHIFFAERQVARVPGIDADTPIRDVKHVGVIGAGTMGGGISMNFLNAGIPVTIVEMQQEALDRGVATIRRNYESAMKKGRISADDVEQRMALLNPSLNFDDLGQCDMVIEAVFELMDIKKDVFSRLDKIAKKGAILASNTSYLDIDEIAAATSRPQDVIGTHFFSPANIMRLLEIVRGKKTGKDVIATALKLAKPLGKVGVVVGNCHGFVGNRMLAQRQREAQNLILEGATPWDVDRVIYDFGMPMGPFQMSDLAGIDIGWNPKTTSSSTIREILCEQGRRGQKTSAGFYDYDDNRNRTPSPLVEKLIKDFAVSKGYEQRDVSDDEILERCLYPMVNEGAKILDEGIALRSSDIDVVWITGYGWPVYLGGPMFWAEGVGLDKIVARLKAFEAAHGDAFKPSPLLERLAAEGKGFSDFTPGA